MNRYTLIPCLGLALLLNLPAWATEQKPTKVSLPTKNASAFFNIRVSPPQGVKDDLLPLSFSTHITQLAGGKKSQSLKFAHGPWLQFSLTKDGPCLIHRYHQENVSPQWLPVARLCPTGPTTVKFLAPRQHAESQERWEEPIEGAISLEDPDTGASATIHPTLGLTFLKSFTRNGGDLLVSMIGAFHKGNPVGLSSMGSSSRQMALAQRSKAWRSSVPKKPINSAGTKLHLKASRSGVRATLSRDRRRLLRKSLKGALAAIVTGGGEECQAVAMAMLEKEALRVDLFLTHKPDEQLKATSVHHSLRFSPSAGDLLLHMNSDSGNINGLWIYQADTRTGAYYSLYGCKFSPKPTRGSLMPL